MRTFVLVAAVLSAASARADSLFDIEGGLAIPVADDTWTKYVDTSPKLEIHAGATGANAHDRSFGAILGIDWTPEKSASGDVFGASYSYSLNRFRALVSGIALFHVAPKVAIDARIGAGVDLAYASGSLMIGASNLSTSDTNVGFAFEVGGGAWFDLGSVDLGGELAVPIGTHSAHTHDNVDYPGYTSVDIDLLFGVRFRR